MRLFLRALLIAFLRFVLLMVGLQALQMLDVSPLPGWTAVLFAYLLQFGLTYAFARWVFRGRAPNRTDITLVMLVFILFETLLEMALWIGIVSFFQASLVVRPSDVWKNYTWWSLLPVAVYVLAVYLAAAVARQKNRKRKLPEGLEG